MISFRNDYSEGAHPSVLEAISKHNFETTCGYSMDPFCHQAADTVRKLTGLPGRGRSLQLSAARSPIPSSFLALFARGKA